MVDIDEQMQGSRGVPTLTIDQKDRRKLAKRIVKAVQPMLEDATRKEAQLGGKPFEKELRELDLILENSLLSRRGSLAASFDEDIDMTDKVDDELDKPASLPRVNGVIQHGKAEKGATEASSSSLRSTETGGPAAAGGRGETEGMDLMAVSTNGDGANALHADGSPQTSSSRHRMPPTPPMSSEEDLLAPLSFGGIPWYLEPFDPVGTTIHEERWTGREVVRGMSEELSELDEDELKGLVDVDMDVDGDVELANGHIDEAARSQPVKARSKKGRANRRWKGFR